MQLSRLFRPILDTILQVHTTGAFQPYYDFNRIVNIDSIKNDTLKQHLREHIRDKNAEFLTEELERSLRSNIFDSFLTTQQRDLYPYVIKLLRLKQFLLDIEGHRSNYWNDSVMRLNFINLCKDTIYSLEDSQTYTLNQLISQAIHFCGIVEPYTVVSYVSFQDFKDVKILSKDGDYLVNLVPITGSKLDWNQKNLTKLVKSPENTFHINNFYLDKFAHRVAYPIDENDILINSRCLWREKEIEHQKFIFTYGIHSKIRKYMTALISNFHFVSGIDTFPTQMNQDDALSDNIKNKLQYLKIIFERRSSETHIISDSIPAVIFDLECQDLLDKPISRVMQDLSR